MTQISELKSLIGQRGGVARPNMYRIDLPTLAGVPSENLNIFCNSVDLPGRSLQTYDKVIGTKYEKVAYAAINPDISASFITMNDYSTRKYFETWQSRAYDVNRYQMKYKDNYAFPFQIHQLRKGISFPIGRIGINTGLPNSILGRLPSGNILDLSQTEIDIDYSTSADIAYTCNVFEAFPISFTSTPLTNEQGGYVQVNVTFSYSRWTSETTEINSNDDLKDFVVGATATLAGQVITKVFK